MDFSHIDMSDSDALGLQVARLQLEYAKKRMLTKIPANWHSIKKPLDDMEKSIVIIDDIPEVTLAAFVSYNPKIMELLLNEYVSHEYTVTRPIVLVTEGGIKHVRERSHVSFSIRPGDYMSEFKRFHEFCKYIDPGHIQVFNNRNDEYIPVHGISIFSSRLAPEHTHQFIKCILTSKELDAYKNVKIHIASYVLFQESNIEPFYDRIQNDWLSITDLRTLVYSEPEYRKTFGL